MKAEHHGGDFGSIEYPDPTAAPGVRHRPENRKVAVQLACN